MNIVYVCESVVPCRAALRAARAWLVHRARIIITHHNNISCVYYLHLWAVTVTVKSLMLVAAHGIVSELEPTTACAESSVFVIREQKYV